MLTVILIEEQSFLNDAHEIYSEKTNPQNLEGKLVNLIGKLRYPALKIFLQKIPNNLFNLISSPGKLGHSWNKLQFLNFYDIYIFDVLKVQSSNPFILFFAIYS